MIRVNDRVVVENNPGTIIETDSGRYDRYRVQFDNRLLDTRWYAESEIIPVSSVPIRVVFQHAVGDRVRFDGVTTFVTERKEIDDQPGYELQGMTGTYHEYDVLAAPLPHLHDDDIEDLLAMYLRRACSTMREVATEREFDNRRSVITVRVEQDGNSIDVTYSSWYGYGDAKAEAGTLRKAYNESIRRAQADKDNKPRSLPAPTQVTEEVPF